MPVLQGGDQINIPVLTPGESVYGTYYETFDAEGEPYEVYYRLIETLVSTVQNDVTGVKISIQPIQSHLSRSIVTYRERKNYFADPVDLATGAFTDSIPVISVTGASELAFNLDYTSLLSGTQGETGRGFYHNFETHIEETDNRITLYLTAGISGTFVHEDTINGIYTGSVSKNNVYLNGGNSDGTYVSLSTATKKYSLYKHADGTYTVTTPAKDCYRYDSAGRCIQVMDDNGRETLISYEDASNSKTITEPVSGKHLYIHYNAEGMVTQVSDDSGRSATFAYTDGNLTAYTNVLGETTTFTYDESNRILTETDCEGITYVTNTYDEAGRVVSQSDADTTKENMRISYEETTKEDGSTLTTVTAYDALGNKGVVVVDEIGAIIQNIDNNGGVTEISYDKNGNEIFEKDALGATITTEYDAAGRKIAVTDQSHITTRFAYDERDNLTAITDGAGNTATYVYNDKNLITKITDYNGMVTTYEYNEYAQLVKKTVEGLGSCTYTYEKGMLIASTDYNGNTTTYTYDGTGAITSKTDALGNTTTYTHDAMLQETGQTDALGNTITYTYDKYGNRLSETDACGATTRYEYDKTGKQTAVILADGSRITYEYDAAGQVTKAISADGTATTYTYDANGNLLTETNEQGETITYTYDALNQRISETSASGNTIRYGYYPNGKPYVTEYPDGTRTLSTYDENWRLIRKTDTGNHSVTYEYDAMGNVTAERDALGNAIRYTYDNQGRVLSVTDKNGNTTTYTYDGNGNCLTKQSADGTLLQFTYDALNRLVKAETIKNATYGEVLEANEAAYTGVDGSDTDVDGSGTGATESSVGQENGQEDSVSPDTEIITVLFEYDALGRLIHQTDEEGGVTTYEYDACGRTTQVTDVLGNVTTYEYDVLGNLIKATDATGAVSTYTYSNTGLLLESINAAETEEVTTTTYTYDEAGRMLSVTDPLEGVVSCTYDVDGNVETVTDAMGGTTTYTYDTLGRLTSETSAIRSVQSYTYNAEGLLEKDTNARKQDTHYTYDALGRIIRMEDEAGTITYEYDANGNVLSVTEVVSSENVGTENGTETDIVDEAVNSKDVSAEDGEATDEAATAETSKAKTITRTYDCMNRVTSYTDVNGRTIRYTYDELGNILSLTYPGGEIVRYTYYASGRMKSVTDSKGRVTYYTYDKAGNLTVTERPDGTKETNTYNAAGQLINKTDIRTSDNAVLSEYHYEYDTRGNIISVTGTGITGVCEAGNGISVSEDGSVSVAEESTEGVGIEESTRVAIEDSLTGAEETVGMDSSVSQEDLQNASVSQAQAAAMAMSDAKMEYDADNRLISYNGEEVKYDADGNMIYGPLNGTMTSFTYDCRNRLIQAGNTRYVYDAENTRIAVETETGRTEYVTDVVSELSQVLEAYVAETKEDDREGTDEVESASETVEKNITYIYGNGLIYEYENDAETSDILVHHYNHIGSTMKLTNAQGEVVENYQYGTYGELLSGDTTKTAYLYNGMYGVATDENGLYYMRARYYNTDIKRFINRDVVKGSMENSQSLNRYCYVQGNPVSLTDPFGLSPFTWSNIGHGLLNALGMIPYIGEVFDLANAAWYMKEGNYAMAALSAISALPMLGNIASGALTMFKCAKAAKYVKTVSKVISNAATFGVAAAGGTKSIKNIYKNVKQGNVLTKENFAELVNIGLSAFTMICSGKNTIASSKELGGMLKEDVPKAWSSWKNIDGLEPGTLSNVDVRKWYLEQEAKIPNLIDESASLKKQAKQAFKLRNKFRTQARKLMADRDMAKSLNKTDANLSWRKIVQKQKNKGLTGNDIYKEIIASSQRSRKAVNKSLGLE